MDDLAGFVTAGVALTGSPGPATLGLAAAGAAFGVRRSVMLLVGTLAGVLVVMAVTAAGLTGLLLAQPALAPAVAVLAAAYMAYLAWRIASAPPVAASARPPAFVTGLVLGFGNPKAYAAMAALFSGFVLLRDRPLADAGAKAAILLAIMAAVDVAWLLVGASLTRAMRRPRIGRAINVAFAALLLVSVAMVFAM